MKKDYILFIDSGIGGLSILAQTLKLKNINCIYYADNKHAPYGAHSKKEIISYLNNIIVDLSQKYRIKTVCIACNTATAAAIDFLRKKYKYLTFIGTEPALNLATKYGFNRIFSLTTPLTKKLAKYNKLKNMIDAKITTYASENLAMLIEKYYLNQTFKNRFNLLKEAAIIYGNSAKYDCIVLGCTHYTFLKPFLKQFVSSKIIDGNFGIAQNIINTLSSQDDKICKKSRIIIKLSSPNQSLIKKYKKILGQTLANCNILC